MTPAEELRLLMALAYDAAQHAPRLADLFIPLSQGSPDDVIRCGQTAAGELSRALFGEGSLFSYVTDCPWCRDAAG